VGKLSDGDRRRLVSLVNLTASEYDNEALQSLRAASRIAQAAGLTLTEALQSGASAAIDVARIQTLEADAFERGREQGVKDEPNREKRHRRQELTAVNTPPAPAPQSFSWHDMRQQCLANAAQLTTRELDFVTSLSRWAGGLTTKQNDWLLAIHQRVARPFP